LNDLVAWAYATGRVRLKSDGTPWRPLVHAEDIARACVAVLSAPRERIHAQAFNVGRTDENYRIRDIAEIVRETVPGSRVEYAPGAAPDQRSYRVDFEKIRRAVPSFVPRWTVRDGARELYEAYRRHGLRADDLEGPRFRRIDQIRLLRANGEIDETLRWRADAAPAGSVG
jgi:nucleoside-diphosphate-sugar epimerase